jgi:hypothetical protein
MEKFECKYCKHNVDLWLLVPFKVDKEFIKHSFHIKQVCAKCHKFQTFVPQTEEVIERLKDCPLLPGAKVYHGQEVD